jgi:ubiquinone biosynthesis protein COQ9
MTKVFAELHQMQSPKTVDGFLDDLLENSSRLGNGLNDVSLYADYFVSSWKGILKSRGIFI